MTAETRSKDKLHCITQDVHGGHYGNNTFTRQTGRALFVFWSAISVSSRYNSPPPHHIVIPVFLSTTKKKNHASLFDHPAYGIQTQGPPHANHSSINQPTYYKSLKKVYNNFFVMFCRFRFRFSSLSAPAAIIHKTRGSLSPKLITKL